MILISCYYKYTCILYLIRQNCKHDSTTEILGCDRPSQLLPQDGRAEDFADLLHVSEARRSEPGEQPGLLVPP